MAALLLRVILGATLVAHGYNHVWRGAGLAGTARWFESIGIRPGRVHAVLASVTELLGGAMLVLGLLTPLAAAASIGTMVVAFVANHRKNGFFIFRPGEGYEYVLMIIVVSLAIAALGGGVISVDAAIGLQDRLGGLPGVVLGGGAGVAGAALVLGVSWRPDQTSEH